MIVKDVSNHNNEGIEPKHDILKNACLICYMFV